MALAVYKGWPCYSFALSFHKPSNSAAALMMAMARCGYLNEDGKQCKRNAVSTRAMHLNGEIYGSIRDPDVPHTDIRDLATWVAVPLCKPHASAFGGTEVKNGTVDVR